MTSVPAPVSSEGLRKALATNAFLRAKSSLEDAAGLDLDKKGPIVHASYLAMYHAAKAVVLFVDGGAPKKKKEVTARFIELLPDSADAKGHGEHLRYAESLNDSEEYDGSVDIEPEEVAEIREDAEGFLMYCAAWIGQEFPSKP